jgi:hypothetical protein
MNLIDNERIIDHSLTGALKILSGDKIIDIAYDNSTIEVVETNSVAIITISEILIIILNEKNNV